MAKFCENCGASLNDSTGCPYCGAAVNSVHLKDSASQKPQKRKKKSLIVFVSFVCLCIVSLIVVTSIVRNEKIYDIVSEQEQAEFVLHPTPKAPNVDSLLNQTFGESCQCGESAYWKLTDSGDTLVIYGTGALYEDSILEKNERNLSYQEQKLIKYIIVDEGITKLSRQNFYNCEVDCLYLPSTLEEIDEAFYIFSEISQIKFSSGNSFFL